MPTETIKQVLIRRDSMSPEDADDLITAAKLQLHEYIKDEHFIEAEDICAEFFGLEPDYIDEIIPY